MAAERGQQGWQQQQTRPEHGGGSLRSLENHATLKASTFENEDSTFKARHEKFAHEKLRLNR